MFKQNCIDTIYHPESLFPSGLTWRTWLRAGMTLAGRQIGRALATLSVWRNRHRQRRQLAALPNEILKNIGVNRADALRESEKTFWRP